MHRFSPILPKVFLGLSLVLIAISMIGAAAAFFVPQIEPVKVSIDHFKMDQESGYSRMKIPRQLYKWRDRGMMPRLFWADGKPITVAKNMTALREMEGVASRVSASNIFITRAISDRLSATQETIILAIDFRHFVQYWIRPALIGALIFLSLWGLSFFRSTGQLSTTVRMAEFDSLRGIAALGVALAHSTSTFFPAEWFSIIVEDGRLQRAPVMAEWIKFSPIATLLNGSMMVSIFWILSGLVLTLPFTKKLDYDKLSQAAVKRYFRLMPLAFFTTLLSFVLMETHALWHSDYIEATGYPTSLLVVRFAGDPSAIDALWDSFFFGYNYNGPLWTIQLEFWGSIILFGILACTMMLKHRHLVWIVISICAIAMDRLFFLDFMLGVFLAVFRHSRGAQPHFLKAGASCLIFITCLILGAASPGWLTYLYPAQTYTSWLHYLITHSAAFGFVVLVTFSASFSRLISCKPLLWLGERSFALYAVHALLVASLGYAVAVILIQNGMSKIPACLMGLISYVVASLIAAHILTRWIDKPSMVFANKAGRWLKGMPMKALDETSQEQKK